MNLAVNFEILKVRKACEANKNVEFIAFLNSRYVDKNSFYLKNLKILKLANNNLRRTPDLAELNNLSVLELSRNNLSGLENSKFPSKLDSLSLAYNELKSFPGLSSLAQIKEIDLTTNDIKNLDNLNLRPSTLNEIHLN